MSSTRRALLWSLGGSQLGSAIALGSGFVLARLLAPADLGLYAMAGVLVALANLFRDFGVGVYIVQAPTLGTDRLRAALSVALGTAWLMAAGLWAASAPFAALLGEPGVAGIVRILALNFLLIPFGSVAFSLLRRQMAFRARAAIETAATLGQTAVSLTLAARGWGAESLAWGSLANVALTVAGTTWARPAEMPWRPGLQGLGEVLRFGAPASGAALLRHLNVSLPTLLIGRALGAADVGLFNRAQGFTQLPQSLLQGPVSNVLLPALAQAHREHRPLAAPYLHSTTLVAGLVLPFALGAVLLAEPVIALLYGPGWSAALPLVLPWALATLAASPFWFANELLLSIARPRSVLVLELLAVAVTGLALLWALLCAPQPDLQRAAWAMVAATVAVGAARGLALHRHFGIRPGQLWQCYRAALLPTAALLPVLAAGAWVCAATGDHPLSTLGVALTALGSYGLALRAVRHPLWLGALQWRARNHSGRSVP